MFLLFEKMEECMFGVQLICFWLEIIVHVQVWWHVHFTPPPPQVTMTWKLIWFHTEDGLKKNK